MEDLDRLRAAFRAPDPPLPEGSGASAVLVPVVPREDGIALLFTRRSTTLSRHPGEISFPGGRIEPGETARAAALREFEEETGILAENVEVFGHVTDFVTHRGNLVVAYAGVLPEEVRPIGPPSEAEVDEVLLVSLAELARPGANAEPGAHALGPVYAVTDYEARELPGGGRERVVHYWPLIGPPAAWPRSTVWGITGELLARFLRRGLDWTPPRAPRRIAAPVEFLP